MTNTVALEQKIKDSGYRRDWIAEQMGISRQSLFQKISNIYYFRADEIAKLSSLLKLTPEERDLIFFA